MLKLMFVKVFMVRVVLFVNCNSENVVLRIILWNGMVRIVSVRLC